MLMAKSTEVGRTWKTPYLRVPMWNADGLWVSGDQLVEFSFRRGLKSRLRMTSVVLASETLSGHSV